MRIAISSAHSKFVRGAKSFIDETDESRRVVDQVVTDLRALGAHVLRFDDNVSKTQTANLRAIVSFHQSQRRERDVSIHFNAAKKTDGPRGVEVLYKSHSQQPLAAKISSAIANSSGLINRGAKHRANLSFLNNLRNAVLIEVCFVDAKIDCDLYKENFDRICKAIAEALR